MRTLLLRDLNQFTSYHACIPPTFQRSSFRVFQIEDRYAIADGRDDRVAIGRENQIPFAVNGAQELGKFKV